jgi:hypothetical protein
MSTVSQFKVKSGQQTTGILSLMVQEEREKPQN